MSRPLNLPEAEFEAKVATFQAGRLTPDEQAWCAWARSVHGDPVLAVRRECETESTRAFCEGSRQARERIRRELLAEKVFFPDGPGEGLVSVPGEEETGEWAVPIAALDKIVPEEG